MLAFYCDLLSLVTTTIGADILNAKSHFNAKNVLRKSLRVVLMDDKHNVTERDRSRDGSAKKFVLASTLGFISQLTAVFRLKPL